MAKIVSNPKMLILVSSNSKSEIVSQIRSLTSQPAAIIVSICLELVKNGSCYRLTYVFLYFAALTSPCTSRRLRINKKKSNFVLNLSNRITRGEKVGFFACGTTLGLHRLSKDFDRTPCRNSDPFIPIRHIENNAKIGDGDLGQKKLVIW